MTGEFDSHLEIIRVSGFQLVDRQCAFSSPLSAEFKTPDGLQNVRSKESPFEALMLENAEQK